MKTLLLAVAVVGLGLCSTDICNAQTVRVRSCWAALDVANQEVRQSALPLKGVDTTTLAVDMKKLYGKGFQVITWSHTAHAAVDEDRCSEAKPDWFDDPA